MFAESILTRNGVDSRMHTIDDVVAGILRNMDFYLPEIWLPSEHRCSYKSSILAGRVVECFSLSLPSYDGQHGTC